MIILVFYLLLKPAKSASANNPVPAFVPTSVINSPSQGYSYKGCYYDTIPGRKLQQYKGNLSIKDCAIQAKNNGYKLFGIQNSSNVGLKNVGGECWMGNNSDYDSLGAADNCYTNEGQAFGGWWSNAVYELS